MTTLEQHAADEARRAEIAKNEAVFRTALSNPLRYYQPPAEEPRALTLADLEKRAEEDTLRSMSTADGVQRELMRMAEKIAPPSTMSIKHGEAGMQFGADAQQHASIYHMYGANCFNNMLECMRDNGQHTEATAARNEVNAAVAIQALIEQNILAPLPLPQSVLDVIELQCLLVEGELLAESMELKL